MDMNSKSKNGSIVLLIVLLICSGLGVSAFVMSLTKCKPCKVEGLQSVQTAGKAVHEADNETVKFAKKVGNSTVAAANAAAKGW